MLRYTSKNTNNIFTQSIEEFCECCGVVESSVHISEVTTKPEHLRDFTYTIKDASNQDYELKLKRDREKEVMNDALNRGMISSSLQVIEGMLTGITESLRYGLRSERMCSSSNAADGEYCFRVVDNAATASYKRSPRFEEYKEKFETKFRDKPIEEPEGYKLGMDRHGNPVRLQSESIDVVNTNGETLSDHKYFGAHKKEWYRKLSDTDKRATITASAAKSDSTNIEDYDYKESFDLDTTASYYTNDTSLIFDGTNDYIKLTGTGDEENGYHYTVDQFDEHGVTISAWVYMSASGSSGHPVLSIGRSNNKYYGYQMRITADFRIAMDYYGAHPTNGSFGQSANHRKTVVQSNAVVPTKLEENVWMQFTCVYGSSDTADWRIYMNGKQMTTKTSGNANVVLTYNGNDGNIGRLGKSNQSTETWFNGIINHVGLWKVALSDSSVAGLYNDGKPPYLLSASAGYTETGSDQLRGYWELAEGSNTSTRGVGGYACHGTLYNFAISEDAPQGDDTSGWTDVSPLIG